MDQSLYKDFFSESAQPFSLHEFVRFDNDNPPAFNYLDVNDAFADCFGMKPNQFSGQRFEVPYGIGEGSDRVFRNHFASFEKSQTAQKIQVFSQALNRWMQLSIFAIGPECFAMSYELMEKESIFESGVSGFASIKVDLQVIMDMEGNLIGTNAIFDSVLGYDEGETIGKNILTFVYESDRPDSEKALSNLAQGIALVNYVNRFRARDGSFRFLDWHAHTDGDYIYASARDVTDIELKAQQLRHQADTDSLTGLYNRNFFYRLIHEELASEDVNSRNLVLAILDIDHFKLVNDMWGHPIGDLVLEELAKILLQNVRKSDFVSRLGGEEFVILYKTGVSNALGSVSRLKEAINRHHFDTVGHITASFGVAKRLPDEAFKSWYSRTDDALYQAKERGRNTIVEAKTMISIFASKYLEWNEDWNSGNMLIDAEHKELLDIGKRLIYAVYPDLDDFTIHDQIKYLISHVRKQFRDEEEVLDKIDYPDREHHRRIHSGLIDRAVALENKYLNRELSEEDVFEFLVDKLIRDHLIREDSKFFKYIK